MRHTHGRLAMPHNIYPKAISLARPVARGWLSLTLAHSSLMVDAVKAERDGDLDGRDAIDVWRIGCHLLGEQVEREHTRRDVTRWRIRQLIKPMLAAHRRSNVILAEAHGVNGAENFPLTEDEVGDVVRAGMYWASQRREQRHVG